MYPGMGLYLTPIKSRHSLLLTARQRVGVCMRRHLCVCTDGRSLGRRLFRSKVSAFNRKIVLLPECIAGSFCPVTGFAKMHGRAAIQYKESLNKSRLTAQRLSCLPFFRHPAQNSIDNFRLPAVVLHDLTKKLLTQYKQWIYSVLPKIKEGDAHESEDQF